MNAELETVKTAFLGAIERCAPGQWEAYLNAAGLDQNVRRQVERLLAAHFDDDSLLEKGAVIAPADSVDEGGLPEPIGPYKPVRLIGEGGFGAVYLVEQQEPVQREVALKIIKPGMNTREVIARFEAERRSLALMEHTNIAKVLECGATSSGLPYFVMELVRGMPITDYCDRHRLDTCGRLKLFVSVCRAVQHAHQKGVIHRDIKPSNVLVSTADGAAMPKIIDFGIARAIERPPSGLTECGKLVGTPLYMSPEQAGSGARDVDTRSDVYSLGVLLYELLTGETPFDRERIELAEHDEVRRVIREEDPPKPSTRVSALGSRAAMVFECRQSDARRLTALLRQDLDWVVMKALEKDPDRRYETASHLARDIERYLNEEPVEARPPAGAYRFARFFRRHRKSLLTAAALALTLVVGTAVSGWHAIRATQSERTAKAEAAASEAVMMFLTRDVLARANPYQEPDRDLKVRDALDRASAAIEHRFQQQPLVEASIRHTVGTAYLTLGEYHKAERHLQRAVDIRRSRLGAGHCKALQSSMHLAIAVCSLGRYAEAEKMHKSLLQQQRLQLGADSPDTLGNMMNLAAAFFKQGRYGEAERMTRRLLGLQRSALGGDHAQTLKAVLNLACMMRSRGAYAEAEGLCRDLLPKQRRVLRPDHPDILLAKSVLASALLGQGRCDEGEKLHQEVYRACHQLLGAEHPDTLESQCDVAGAALLRGRPREALDVASGVLKAQQRTLGATHPATLETASTVAGAIHALGDHQQAEKLYQELCERRSVVLGADHPATLNSRLRLSSVLLAQRRNAEAESLCRELSETLDRALGPDHPETLKAKMNLGVAIHTQGRFTEAEALRRDLLDAQMRILGADHPDTLGSMLNLANTLVALDRCGEAEGHYRLAQERMQQVLGSHHPHTLTCIQARAKALVSLEQFDAAESLMRQAVQRQRAALGVDHPGTLRSINALAWFLCFSAPADQRKPAEAVSLAKEAVAQRDDIAALYRTLGQAQYRAGNLPAAIQSLEKSTSLKGRSVHDILTLALVHWRLNQREQAAQLYQSVRAEPIVGDVHRLLMEEVESLIRSAVAESTK